MIDLPCALSPFFPSEEREEEEESVRGNETRRWKSISIFLRAAKLTPFPPAISRATEAANAHTSASVARIAEGVEDDDEEEEEEDGKEDDGDETGAVFEEEGKREEVEED